MDDVDEVEFEAARTGDHPAAAERFARLADAVAEAGTSSAVTRAELLVRAGAQWQLAGLPDRAAAAYQQALDDGGTAAIDPRACLADAFFDLGREDDARDLIAAIQAEVPTDPEVYNFLAETLEAQRDLAAAHEWATAGLHLLSGSGGGSGSLLDSLLRARYRVRREMRLPEDDYDRRLEASIADAGGGGG